MPDDWAGIMKVALNVPLKPEKALVIVCCVPKSMPIGPGDEKPTPAIVTTEPTEPDNGLIRIIFERILKAVAACSLCVLAVISFVP